MPSQRQRQSQRQRRNSDDRLELDPLLLADVMETIFVEGSPKRATRQSLPGFTGLPVPAPAISPTSSSSIVDLTSDQPKQSDYAGHSTDQSQTSIDSTDTSSSPPSVIDEVCRRRWAPIWRHMPNPDPQTIYRNKMGKIEWRCNYCSQIYLESGGTRIISTHLKNYHHISDTSPREERKHKVQGSIERAMAIAKASSGYKRRRMTSSRAPRNFFLNEIDDAVNYEIDPAVLEVLFVRWFTRCSVALSMVECEEFRAIANYLYQDVDAWLPATHRTCSTWIDRQYEEHKKQQIGRFKEVEGLVHLVVDGWTAKNGICILGIVAKAATSDGIYSLTHPLLSRLITL